MAVSPNLQKWRQATRQRAVAPNSSADEVFGTHKRLDRDLAGRFRTKSYAAEELVAELGAAFLCAHLGVQGQLRHAEYIKSCLDLLRDDNRAIFTAASKASQAADFLRGFSEQVEEAA